MHAGVSWSTIKEYKYGIGISVLFYLYSTYRDLVKWSNKFEVLRIKMPFLNEIHRLSCSPKIVRLIFSK